MISIIVPIYNVENFISTTVQSILQQEGSVEYEVILVDDGSSDGSSDLCDMFSSEHPQVSVIHKKNGGLSSARNVGIAAAKGDYLLFLDGDDCIDSCTLQTLSKAAKEHPGCDFIQFRYEEVYPEVPFGHKVSATLQDYYECDSVHDFFLQLHQLGGVAASSCTKLIKRTALGDLRFKEGIIHEDEQFITHFLPRCHRVGYCSNEFYKYAMRQNSIIHSVFSTKKLDTIAIIDERIDYLKSKEYRDLVSIFQSRLFDNLYLMWSQAYAVKDFTSLGVIEKRMNQLCKEAIFTVGSIEKKLVYHSGCLRSFFLKCIYYTRKVFQPFQTKYRNALVKKNIMMERKEH